VNDEVIGDVYGIGFAFRGGSGTACRECSVVSGPSSAGGLAALFVVAFSRRRRRLPRRSRLPSSAG
jgi:MYXO-CTERM domain-containing protein